MERLSNPGRDGWATVSIVAAAAVSMAVPVLILEREALCGLFFDDAFYYFQVARNAAAGQGWTFDGIHATNGFHPLWMFVLVPLFAAFPGDVAVLRVVGVLETALIALGCVGIFRLLRSRIGTGPALLAAWLVLAMPGARSILRTGLEGALFFALFVLVWGRWQAACDDRREARPPWLLLGLCCSLAFLARLEGILLVPAVLWLERRRLMRRPDLVAAFLAAPAASVGGYLLWNRMAFGSWMPVSSLVKSHMAGELPLSIRLGGIAELPWIGNDVVLRLFGVAQIRAVPWFGKLVYAALVAGVVLALWCARKRVREARIALILLAGAAIVAADIAAVVQLPEWYRVPILLSTALLAASLCAALPRAWIRALLLATALLILARPVLGVWKIGDGSGGYAFYRIRAADWLRENTAPGTRVGSWNAGMLGYFSHRPVVNLDGLANDLEYLRSVVLSRRLCDYLSEEDIDLLADQACGEHTRPTIYLRRFGCEKAAAEFRPLRQFHNERSVDGCPGYVVWSRRRE